MSRSSSLPPSIADGNGSGPDPPTTPEASPKGGERRGFSEQQPADTPTSAVPIHVPAFKRRGHSTLVLVASCSLSFTAGAAVVHTATRTVLLPCAVVAAATALLLRLWRQGVPDSSSTRTTLAIIVGLLAVAESQLRPLAALPPWGGAVPPQSTTNAVRLLFAVLAAGLLEVLCGRPVANAIHVVRSLVQAAEQGGQVVRGCRESKQLGISADVMRVLSHHQTETLDALCLLPAAGKPLPTNQQQVAELANAVDYNDLKWKLMDHAKPFGVHLEVATVGTEATSVVRGSIDIATNMIDLASLLANDEVRPNYDDLLEKTVALEECSDYVKITHALYREAWPFAKRDFITVAAWDVTDTGSFVTSSRSLNTDQFPPKEGYERAQLHLGGFCVRQLPDGKHCRLSAIAHFNLSGEVPAMMVNWGQTVAIPGMLNTIQKLTVGHVASSDFAERFLNACRVHGQEGPFLGVAQDVMLPVLSSKTSSVAASAAAADAAD